MVFPITRLTFQVRKFRGGGGGWVVACRIIVSAQVPFPFLLTSDLGFLTWILDLDFGPGFWTGLGLDKFHIDLLKFLHFLKPTFNQS